MCVCIHINICINYIYTHYILNIYNLYNVLGINSLIICTHIYMYLRKIFIQINIKVQLYVHN